MKTDAGRSVRQRGKEAAAAAVGTCLFGIFVGFPQSMLGAVSDAGGTGQGLALLAGSDSSTTCPSYPCASVTVTSSNEARLSLSIGKDSVNDPQPEVFYTDLLRVYNPTDAPIGISTVVLGGVTESRAGDIGMITVFYCAAQTDDPRDCAASYITSTSRDGTVFTGTDTVAPGAFRYIEFAGFAGPAAQPGDALSFVIKVTAG